MLRAEPSAAIFDAFPLFSAFNRRDDGRDGLHAEDDGAEAELREPEKGEGHKGDEDGAEQACGQGIVRAHEAVYAMARQGSHQRAQAREETCPGGHAQGADAVAPMPKITR